MKVRIRLFFTLSIALLSTWVNAQNKPVTLNLSTIRTDLEQQALSIGIEYAKSLDSLWEQNDFLLDYNNSLLLITPDFEIQSGTDDAFSSISAKITGLGMIFKDTIIAEQVTPNTARTFHTIPISIGIETNNTFEIMNGIFEVGYVPWYQAETRKTPIVLKRTKIGLFIQTGYKFDTGSSNDLANGGDLDESEEDIDEAILRVKGSFGIDTGPIINFHLAQFGIIGESDGWYDLLNTEVYYRVKGLLRTYISSDNFIDFQYQKGSGAPNFNRGDQYGIGLTVMF